MLLWILSAASQLSFQRGKCNNRSFHWGKRFSFWWVLMLVYLTLTAIQERSDSRQRLLPRPRKLLSFFGICQVFNANLPLLVTSAFPSSRLLLFSLKRLWSPADPGDLHRASLVKCLGWIRRDGWERQVAALSTLFLPITSYEKSSIQLCRLTAGRTAPQHRRLILSSTCLYEAFLPHLFPLSSTSLVCACSSATSSSRDAHFRGLETP